MTMIDSVQHVRVKTGDYRLPQRRSLPANPFVNLSLAALIQQHRFQPDHTAIMGVCDDGLPILVDWTNPRPGSFLIGGSNQDGVTQLLQLAAISTLAHTPHRQLEILVLSGQPEKWTHFERFPGEPNLVIIPAYEREAGAAILRCSRMLDQRMNGRRPSELMLILIDDLTTFSRSDFDVQIGLQYVARQGPHNQMWTLAGIDAGLAQECDRFLPSFQTRILGQIADPFQAGWLANRQAPDTAQFHPSQQFCVCIRDQWVNFWLPGQA